MPDEYDLRPFLKRFFERSAHDKPWIAVVQDFSKAFFDFIRNLTIVGGLKYLSDQSNNAHVYAVFFIAQIILLLQVNAYIAKWNLVVFSHLISAKRIGEILDLALNVLISIALFVLAIRVIGVALQAIAHSHG